MSIKFGEINLFSTDPQKLYSFVSFILDIEADVVQADKISFVFDGIRFVIYQIQDCAPNSRTDFTLNLTDVNEFLALKQNVEFYYYKEGKSDFGLNQTADSLSFTDPDGRMWVIKTEFSLLDALNLSQNISEHKLESNNLM